MIPELSFGVEFLEFLGKFYKKNLPFAQIIFVLSPTVFKSFKLFNMKKHLLFYCMTIACTALPLLVFTQNPAPFFSETFPNAQAFQENWTQGGTNGGPETWKWSNTPDGIFNGQADFASTTVANGFVIFNSDANGNFEHDVFFTSKAINCSGKSKVFLRCENQYAYFSVGDVSKAEVGVSTDGTTFVYKTILADVEQNDLSDPVQVVIVELPEAANQANVFIRFRWRGFFEYTWRIDDIGLFDTNPLPANELVVDNPLVPTNFATPISQADSVFFAYRLANRGAMAQTNIEIKATVSSDNGSSFSTSEVINELLPAVTDTVVLEEAFVPTAIGNYTVSYAATQAESDVSPENNSLELSFAITENVFAKDDGIIISATQPGEVVDEFWEVGNFYSIINEGYEAYEAFISVASQDNQHQGKSVSVILYKVVPDNNPDFNDDDLEVVGFGSYEFTTEENYDPISVELFPVEGELVPGVKLDRGDYLLTIQYTPEMFVPFSAIGYYYDIATVVKNGTWFLGGFGSEVTSLVRMNIREEGSTRTNEVQLTDKQVRVFPNPANDVLNIKVELENNTAQAEFKVMDTTGKTLWRSMYNDISQQTAIYDTSELAAGTYFLHIRTDQGVKTKRFIVQH